MTGVQALVDITRDLHEHAKVRPGAEEREAYIAALTEMLEKRGEILADMGDAFSAEERVLLKEAVDMNGFIEGRLQEELGFIKMDINELKRKKTTGRRYENPYGDSGPIDGAFIDKRN
ncbi:hypothetical protein [Alteribacter aurantiacus]|uniref:hypothetical protein n=1 Tax=Alteribacter aurantiacus TaxID=254410 RepID=UPI000420BE2E|nr:hypothetical protein [Alteribacter aurantiacus]